MFQLLKHAWTIENVQLGGLHHWNDLIREGSGKVNTPMTSTSVVHVEVIILIQEQQSLVLCNERIHSNTQQVHA